jgi:lipopolysaccharide transport system ATP-binding protein
MYDKPRDRLLQMLSRSRKPLCREFWALQDVSFEIHTGETVGVVGRNGSGKSTLLQMICGTVTPTSGAVQAHGRVAALLELGAGFNGEFTGRENVMLNAAILGFPPEDMASRMEQVLGFSELGDFLDQPVKTYSSGMHSRLAFATAIHVDPDILIVDEALAVGDARFVAKCMRRIKDMQANGVTILFVSHDVGSVRTLCKQAIWLDKGRLVERGNVFPVTGRYMEFMFRDDEAEGDASQQALVAPAPVAAECVLDARPVTHWGSHKGLIQSASVRDGHGAQQDVLPWGDRLEIVIDLRVPQSIPREHLSVAFSIKDLKGTDLIVSTTQDFGANPLPDEDCFSVSFELTNPLVTGRYLLVAAVENRKHRDIHYYEYVEGAQYFSSLSERRLFGIFQPAIEQRIRVA